jgi:hypothetical protein
LLPNYTKGCVGYASRPQCGERRPCPRGARLGVPGTLHHVMVRGIARPTIVNDDENRESFTSRMGKLAGEKGLGTLLTNYKRLEANR